MNILCSQFNMRSELNAVFTFFFDVIVTLFVMVGLLTFVGYPIEFTVAKILPALVIGILIGNIIFSWMAAKAPVVPGKVNTALPLGIDITTVVPIILLIIGPSLQYFKAEFGDPEKALLYSWYVGMGTSIWLGIIKFGLAFCSDMLRRILPMAGMLGSVAGVAFAWLGVNPILELFELPLIGFLALLIVMVSIMAHIRLPGGVPGAVGALVLCLPLYYLFGMTGILPENQQLENINWDMIGLHLPSFQTGGFSLLFSNTLGYLSLIVPLGILIAIIATNITAAAAISGNNYSTRKVIMTDAFATFCLGCFGGIGQTTPYLGHETYHKMGARYLYAIMVIVLMMVICFSGLLNVLLAVIPSSVFLPLLVIVCLDIIIMSFKSTGQGNNSAAIIIAMIPAVANLIYVKVDEIIITMHYALAGIESKIAANFDLSTLPSEVSFQIESIMSGAWFDGYFALRLLSNGYILTAIIWGAVVTLIMEKKLYRAALFMSAGAILSIFGIMHSVMSSGSMYLPWTLTELGVESALTAMPYEVAGAYMICAAFLVILAFRTEASEETDSEKESESNMGAESVRPQLQAE